MHPSLQDTRLWAPEHRIWAQISKWSSIRRLLPYTTHESAQHEYLPALAGKTQDDALHFQKTPFTIYNAGRVGTNTFCFVIVVRHVLSGAVALEPPGSITNDIGRDFIQQGPWRIAAICMVAADETSKHFLRQIARILPRSYALCDIALNLRAVLDEHVRNPVGTIRVVSESTTVSCFVLKVTLVVRDVDAAGP